MGHAIDIAALAVLVALDGLVSEDAVFVVKVAGTVIVSLLSAIGAWAAWSWKRLLDEVGELRETQRKQIGLLHGRIDKLPDEYVPRREYDLQMKVMTAALEKVERALGDVVTSIRANHAENDARLDGLANGMAELNISLNELKREARR